MKPELNLHGRKLIAVAAENSPHVLKNSSKLIDPGYEVEILRQLAHIFNFSYELKQTERDTGVLLPNHTWTGVMGHVLDGRADIGLGGLTYTQDRLKYVSFLAAHHSSHLTFITNWPEIETRSLIVAIDKYIILSLILSITLIMFTISMINYHFTDLKRLPLKWTILAIGFRQNIDHKTIKQDSLRIIISTWQFAVLLISILLGGLIYKSFSMPKTLKTIDNLYQLSESVKSGSIEVYINKKSARYSELKSSKRSIIKVIYKNLKFLKRGQSGVGLVRNSPVPVAIIDYRVKFDYELHSKGQNTYHIPPIDQDTNFKTCFFSLIVRKEFPHKKIFKKRLKGMINAGIINHLLRMEQFRKDISYSHEKNGSDKEDGNCVKIINSLLFICYSGLTLSISTIIIEIVYKKFVS